LAVGIAPSRSSSDPPADWRVAPDQSSPVIDWHDWYDWFMSSWEQGQHVTMIGTTGSGKTTLVKLIIGAMRWVVVVGVKARDETMNDFIRAGYRRIKSWQGAAYDDYLCYWPDLKSLDDLGAHRQKYLDCLNGVYRSGGWTVVLDEISFLSDMLNLDKPLRMLLNQGRSSGITVVSCTQRPAFIPLACYDQASHLLIWKDPDRRNIKRLAELTGNSFRTVMQEVPSLAEREVLYIHKNTGTRVRFTVEV
jgi:energy-coupling factor transporter ATP-binding protein EcfA2